MFKKLLIPTDFSLCAEAARRHGLFLAERYTAAVDVLHVAPTSNSHAPPPLADAAWRRALAGDAEALAQSCGGSERRHLARHADPVAAILDVAREVQSDLIVVGAHGDRGEGFFLSQGIGQAFVGRTAEQVARHAGSAVLQVRMGGGGSPEQVHRILVPADDSTLSRRAVETARALADAYGARLDLLHVLDGREPDAEAQKLAAVAMLAALFEAAPGPAVPVRFHAVRGRPERVIRRFARRLGTDLVVQGAHSDQGTDLLGAVAAEVLRTASCSVLTMRAAPEGRPQLATQAPHERTAPVA
ncbi:MAG: universal stress protein [Rhodothermales bacterium]|nr:universal stress protein [Rhodothermales bacterium]